MKCFLINYHLIAVMIFCVFLPGISDAQLKEVDPQIIHKSNAPVKALAYSAYGETLASAGDDKTIYFRNTKTGELTGSIAVFFMVKALQFTEQGDILAACGPDIRLMNRDGKLIRTFAGYTTDIWSMSYNSNSGKISAGSYSKSIRVWNFINAELSVLLEGHEKSCLPVCFNPDGTILASGSLDKSVRLWDVLTGRQMFSMELHSGNIFAVAFHPSGKFVLSASTDKTIRLWSADSGKIIRTYAGHSGAVFDVQFSADGRHFLSCSADRTIVLWETATGNKLYTFAGHTGMVNTIRFSPDDKSFASASDDQTVRLWPLQKKCYVDFYYLNEIENAISASSLFEPRRENETRQVYSEREKEADAFVNRLYEEYYEKYVEKLNRIDPVSLNN
jgi:WD40 repeat protein